MKTDENICMPLARIAHAYRCLSRTSRYLFSDSRQRIVTYILITLCFLSPPSTAFVLYQGTTQKIEYKDVNMLREMKMEDRRVVFEFCQLVVKFPTLLNKKMTNDQVSKSKPICEQLLLGIKKVRESERRAAAAAAAAAAAQQSQTRVL